MLVTETRDLAATRRFFTRALEHGPSPIEVTTDHAAAYPRVLDELVPRLPYHRAIRKQSDRIRSRTAEIPTASDVRAQTTRCARVITAGHAFIHNIRRGHYGLGDEETANLRVLTAFDELVMAI